MTDDSTVEHQVNNECKGGSSIEFFRIDGGTHTWPGSAIDFGVTNYDINASEEIWRFFSQYDLNGALSSTANINSEQDLRLFPSIVNDRLNLSFSKNASREISLFTAAGMMVQNQKSSEKDLTLSLTHLISGMYFIRVESEQYINTQHFIKI